MAKAYEIKSDWSKIKHELRRLKRVPTLRDKQKLDRVLRRAMMAAQMQTHIDTGSLFTSADDDSALYGNVYIGEFTFGGQSEGINNPVDYAIYEQDRGGGHDFMRGIEQRFHAEWVQAIKEILKG